jgi:hypothetical protein
MLIMIATPRYTPKTNKPYLTNVRRNFGNVTAIVANESGCDETWRAAGISGIRAAHPGVAPTAPADLVPLEMLAIWIPMVFCIYTRAIWLRYTARG